MMANYELFDSVRLREAISLADGQRIEAGTQGVVVELFAEFLRQKQRRKELA